LIDWFRANIYGPFAAGSFHTKKLCSRLYSTDIEFYLQQKQKFAFEPPFRKLIGVT